MRITRRGFLPLPIVALIAACAPSAQSAAPVTGAGSTVGKRVAVQGGSFTRATATELKTMLAKKDFPLVNVRVPNDGLIPGTDLTIAYDTIGSHLDQLPADKSKKIFLYCRSGNTSQIAATTLVQAGYTDVWDLDGGIGAWKDAGYETLPWK